MNLQDKLFDYLKDKIPEFTKSNNKNGTQLFTCPKYHSHKFKSRTPTATFLPNSDKINCLICGFKGSIFDCVRALEEDKKYKSDAEITEYLIGSLNLDIYKELDNYINYDWSLIPLLKNSKVPFEKDWTNTEHKDKTTWIKWLNNGLNMGLNCSKSKVTVVDVDLKIAPTKELEEIYKILNDIQTLTQSTPHGKHFVFQFDKDLKQATNLGNLHIDIRNEGGQIVIAPSKIDNLEYRWVNLGAEIKVIPEEIKNKLLSLNKIENNKKSSSEIIVPEVEKLGDGQGRNNTLISIGGSLVNKFKPEEIAYILSLISKNFFNPPLPQHEIKAMLGSLEGYKVSEEEGQEKSIYEYLKLVQSDIGAKDIMESLNISRAVVDKYLSKFVKEGKAIRMGRGRYQYKEKITWEDDIPEAIREYEYKIPIFNNIATFADKDVILLGGKPNEGKTHISLNILKQIIEQGIKPYYIHSESNCRWQTIGKKLTILGKFYRTFHANPLQIELEYNAFTIIDWLIFEDKSQTDTILKYLNDELQRKGGILVIFTQLKQDYSWFAPNLITAFPSFAARYIQDNEEHTEGHWQIDKIKESRGNYTSYILPCEYNKDTKIFKTKDII